MSVLNKCWVTNEWHLNSAGYLVVYDKDEGRQTYGHRYSYETLVGPIPDGLHIDHLCENKACYNPRHLEPVTFLENVRRWQVKHVPDTCPHGHRYTEANTYRTPRGHRRCKECNRQRAQAHRDAQLR